MLEMAVHAFITLRLDCSNSLYRDIAQSQLVQNSAARFIRKSRKYEQITPCGPSTGSPYNPELFLKIFYRLTSFYTTKPYICQSCGTFIPPQEACGPVLKIFF